MSLIKSREEIELIRNSAQLVSKTLGMIASEIKEGITTLQLDRLAEDFIRSNNGIPGFLGLYDFPNTLCISPNNQVVHGIPNNDPIKDGDIISIDCGVLMNGYYGDHAYTFGIGNITKEAEKLLDITKKSLYEGIKKFKSGNRVGDVGYAIQDFCESNGYGVVRELVGHGLGKTMHEKPEMPNYGKRGKGKKFTDGMVVAIEPMINQGTHKIRHHRDGWTITTLDNKLSAHFEHNIAIIDGNPELLSTFSYIYDILGIDSDEEKEFTNIDFD
jgi:methionyl aminopeptidase